MMKCVDYSGKYAEDVKDLLMELQEYIMRIDRLGYNILTDEYREKYFEKTMNDVNKYNGKLMLAISDDVIVGLIIGVINNEEETSYDFKAPKRGRITELVVSKSARNQGIGVMLVKEMEGYLKRVGCKDVILGVLNDNINAMDFYKRMGYESRYSDLTKKL